MNPENAKNVIVERKPPSAFSIAIAQLKSPLIYVLLIAAGLTMYLGDDVDTAVILAAVIINTILGFIQERRAQRGLAALKRILTPTTKVVRNGQTVSVDARTIDVGDIVVLTAGDRIPADGRLTETIHSFTNEAILTGESNLVEKTVSKDNKVFAGTILASGRATFTVTDIGMNTKLGKIAEKLQTTKEEATPLQHQLAILAKQLATIVVAISVLIFLIGLVRGQHIVEMFTLAVAIAVAAIPEGMAVTLTVILSVGMQRILKRKAIVRQLVSAETLGSVSVLCVDKTGTLTEGVMKVSEVHVSDTDLAIKAAVFANNLANPIDIALWGWVQSQDNHDPQKIADSQKRLHEVPFDGAKKYMLVRNSEGTWVKGAPEIILSHTRLTQAQKTRWQHEIDDLAHKGLRVIGLAWRKTPPAKKSEDGLSGLTFIGIIGVSDPIRDGVKDALNVAKDAGVKSIVVTGDYRLTSESVMRSIGIPISDPKTQIMEGDELRDISIEELTRRIQEVRLFCRVTPEDKLKIVTALQKTGEVVGMTGDGVNDSLAIKKADIGLTVSSASDVAKDNADIVLLDSNFGTIVATIEEGRVMFQNIRKVVLYLLSDAFTEMFLIITSLVLFIPLPLTAIQILWINILSDGFPDLALSQEPKEFDVMRRPPRPKTSPIMDLQVKIMIGVISFFKALVALTAYLWAMSATGNVLHAQTLAFAVVGSGSLIYAFSTRNLTKTIFQTNPFKNPWLILAVVAGLTLEFLVIYQPNLHVIFKTYPLALFDWLIVAGAGLFLISVSETTKFLIKRTKIANHKRLENRSK